MKEWMIGAAGRLNGGQRLSRVGRRSASWSLQQPPDGSNSCISPLAVARSCVLRSRPHFVRWGSLAGPPAPQLAAGGWPVLPANVWGRGGPRGSEWRRGAVAIVQRRAASSY